AVNALVEAHLEIARPDFLDALSPVGLAEEVVIQQDDVPGVRLLAPDVQNGLLLDHGPFLPRHDAELALQPTAPLREADAVRVVRVHAVILLLRGDADVFQPFRHVPAGPTDFGIALFLEQGVGRGPGPLEARAGRRTV